jgi:hypothetical protein
MHICRLCNQTFDNLDDAIPLPSVPKHRMYRIKGVVHDVRKLVPGVRTNKQEEYPPAK